MQLQVSLSKLVMSRRIPRRVRPEREAHRRLVASIRSHGLLEPLVVRAAADPKHYLIIAGNRRLAALREVHKGTRGDPKIPCVLRDVGEQAADALSLAENFAREAMHPLDEAMAFAKLATDEGKGGEAIAAQFGVSPQYVRQRIKLATLAEPVQAAFRENRIDTGMAEAFASVPNDRQVQVWEELRGNPRHAEQVRSIIANGWVDATLALFDPSKLPEQSVSRDLFSERVLVERQAFMDAQGRALASERERLIEEGWSEVIIGPRSEVQDRLYAMNSAEEELDAESTRKLEKLNDRWEKLEAKAGEIADDDDAARQEVQEKLDAIQIEASRIATDAPRHHSEATKAIATVFLILDPDGNVHRDFRVPRKRVARPGATGIGRVGDGSPVEAPKPPTSDDLSDSQLAVTFTQQALAVREALLANRLARKRVLALLLHDKVRCEALAIRHEANGTTLHASNDEGFTSGPKDRLAARREKLDPFHGEHFVADADGYQRLADLCEANLDALIELLSVECLTAHPVRPTPLVKRLADELKVGIRDHWRPDPKWLGSFKKIQLAHLLSELQGAVYSPHHDTRKKSELVEAAAKLFADAAEGRLEDKKLASRVNGWVPSNLRLNLEPAAKVR